MRVNTVKKCRKAQGTCGCGKEIKKGDAYKWAQGRYGPRMVKCDNCGFRPSELCGGKLSEVYAAQEEAEDSLGNWAPEGGKEGLEELCTALAERLNEIADEYQESCDNIRDTFTDSPTADECEEKADQLRDWASEAESPDIEDPPEVEPTVHPEEVECEACEAKAKFYPDLGIYRCTDKECADEFEPEEEDVEESEMEDWAENAKQTVEDILGNCPL
jgi:hypothetical protein